MHLYSEYQLFISAEQDTVVELLDGILALCTSLVWKHIIFYDFSLAFSVYQWKIFPLSVYKISRKSRMWLKIF